MRRTAVHVTALAEFPGIISAHAENRPHSRQASGLEEDHLRACGEQFDTNLEGQDIIGSSPRMRRTGRNRDRRET